MKKVFVICAVAMILTGCFLFNGSEKNVSVEAENISGNTDATGTGSQNGSEQQSGNSEITENQESETQTLPSGEDGKSDYVIKFNPSTIMVKVGETVNVSQYLEFSPAESSANKTVEFSVPDGSQLWLTPIDKNGNVKGNMATEWYGETSYDVAVVNATVANTNKTATLQVVVGGNKMESLSTFKEMPVFADASNFDDANIYIFIRVIGSSNEGQFVKTSASLMGGTTTTYPKRLYFQTQEGTNPDYYAAINSSQIKTSDSTYGFADNTGKILDTKSYFGSYKFTVSKNGSADLNFLMRNFTIEDPSNSSGWQGAVSTIVRCSDISFKIPMSQFNQATYENKAMFTITLSPIMNGKSETGKYTATTSFDGFVPKNSGN